jgi:hypothetical protein
MAHATESAVTLQTRHSRYLTWYLLMVHGAALAVPLLTPLWFPARIAAALLVLLSLVRQLRTHSWRRGRQATRALRWRADGRWTVTDGAEHKLEYARCQVVLAEPALILAQLRSPGRRHWLVLAADSAGAEPLRQLRVRLRRPDGGRCDQETPLAGR